jgi:integrase
MASLCNDRGGRRRILFFTETGQRKAIRLGKCSQRQAEAFKLKLEDVLAARFTGKLDTDTAQWLADLSPDMQEKLAGVGLVKVLPGAPNILLGEFLDKYIAERTDAKPQTIVVLGHTVRNLIAYFGREKALEAITAADGDGFRRFLIASELSDATIRRRCTIAKQFLRSAVRRRIIAVNPFEDFKAGRSANKSREYFLSRQDAEKILEACPDNQWRTIFVLARYGALRCPSEILSLKWVDVDWSRSRLLVHSPKTEHHEGHESRLVPIFPEIRPHLLAAFEEAAEGAEYVIAERYRKSPRNFRKQLTQIVAKAGLKLWPKPWQNCRSSRETELVERWPEHIVCAWLGHSQVVARTHYLQVRDSDFLEAAQNEAHSVQESSGMERKVTEGEAQKPLDFPCVAASCSTAQDTPMGDTGFGPVTSRV